MHFPRDCISWNMSDTTASGGQSRAQRLDRSVRALADEHRRDIVRYFRARSTETASLEALTEHVIENSSPTPPRTEVRTTLHHQSVPLLAEAGIVDYDQRNNLVRYCPPEDIEWLLTAVSDSEVLPADARR